MKPRANLELPSAKRLALLCGTTVRAAHNRLWRYRHGEIDEGKLYAGRRETREASGPRCPVTAGLPTGMSEAGFRTVCEHNLRHKRRADGKRAGALDLQPAKRLFASCEWCGGERENWPEELSVIEDGRKQA